MQRGQLCLWPQLRDEHFHLQVNHPPGGWVSPKKQKRAQEIYSGLFLPAQGHWARHLTSCLPVLQQNAGELEDVRSAFLSLRMSCRVSWADRTSPRWPKWTKTIFPFVAICRMSFLQKHSFTEECFSCCNWSYDSFLIISPSCFQSLALHRCSGPPCHPSEWLPPNLSPAGAPWMFPFILTWRDARSLHIPTVHPHEGGGIFWLLSFPFSDAMTPCVGYNLIRQHATQCEKIIMLLLVGKLNMQPPISDAAFLPQKLPRE